MSLNTARLGRRRRVLNEEVLTAGSAIGIAARTDLARSSGDTPRYGEGANIENHPQITDYVPRRFRAIAALLLGGLFVAAAGEMIARHADRLSSLTGVVSPAEITAIFSDGLIAWTSATALLMAACLAKLIFSLRRHRVDDSRGRYRIWRLAAFAAVALSLNSVVRGHEVVARVLGHFSGWSLLPEHAGWWLLPATIFGGWLLITLIREAAECRSASTVYSLALICFAVAGLSYCGWMPAALDNLQGTADRLLPVIGNLFLLTGSLLFARYVVLDVQGLIDHGEAIKSMGQSSRDPGKSKNSGEDSPAKRETAWVDGSEQESDDHPQEGRRLSKVERKRLRKQKSRNQAA